MVDQTLNLLMANEPNSKANKNIWSRLNKVKQTLISYQHIKTVFNAEEIIIIIIMILIIII